MTTDRPEQVILPDENFADWVAALTDEQRSRVTPAERADRLLGSPRRQRA